MEDCIFCKIVKGDIPSFTVYQDNDTLAFLDINPNTRGHTLVIPKKHADNITDMEDKDIASVFRTVRKVVSGLQAAIDPDGFNLVVNHGEVAGQVIHHFHCHVVPRNIGDGVKYTFDGSTLHPQEFKELAVKVAENIH
ncbi:MAG: HIT family protein [Methanosarcinales archaeon]|nr:HIT family protein [ANME-2 cluster archaeon]MDF1530794.1 HIT family protein [ANME-2 cluster archaeon]MDW7777117.1 HIT family protein [Methanosarcinales archaeon]